MTMLRSGRMWLVALGILGLLVRLPWLFTPGTTDTLDRKGWAYAATRVGPTGVYALQEQPEPPISPATIQQAIKAELPLERIEYGGRTLHASYPPGSVFLFWPLALLFRAFISPEFQDRPSLNAVIKTPIVLAEIALSLLLYWLVRRRGETRRAMIAGLAYWLNPTVILGGAVLGYLDVLYSLPLVAGAVLLLLGRPAGLWAGWALALIFKPQPLVALPAVLALTMRRGVVRLLGYAGLAGAILGLVALPFLLTGNFLGMIVGSVNQSHDPFVSALQLNFWWLWSYLFQATHGRGWGAVTEIEQRWPMLQRTGWDTQLWGFALFGLFTAFLVLSWLWRQRREGQAGPPGAGGVVMLALQFYGATMLLTSGHENHLLGAVPLPALAAAWAISAGASNVRRFWHLYAAISAVVGANIFMFYGIGEGLPNPLPRMWLGFDGSIVITVLNIALFCACCALWARGAWDDG